MKREHRAILIGVVFGLFPIVALVDVRTYLAIVMVAYAVEVLRRGRL